MQKDSLFARPLGEIEGFRFNEAVVGVFPDMLKRSVPGYESIITQSALLANRYAQPNTRLYDLGSSLGATSIAMRNALVEGDPSQTQGCEIHAIDNAPAMIEACRTLIDFNAATTGASAGANKSASASAGASSDATASSSAGASAAASAAASSDADASANASSNDKPDVPIVLHEANLQDHPLSNASVVAMNFTLQFVNPDDRPALMQKIADALLPGGALILSEKVCFSDPAVNELHIDMYHAFKSQNGYSDLEISQKRTALENVLVPDTLEQHQERLLNAGFKHCTVWFQCFNFASLIAIKG